MSRFGNKIKQKMTMKVIGKGINEMGNAIKAFREDVADVPCGSDACDTCRHCRERAECLQKAIDNYFAVYLKPKGGFRG